MGIQRRRGFELVGVKPQWFGWLCCDLMMKLLALPPSDERLIGGPLSFHSPKNVNLQLVGRRLVR